MGPGKGFDREPGRRGFGKKAVGGMVGDPVGGLVGDPVGGLVGDPVGGLVGVPVVGLVEYQVVGSVRDMVGGLVRDAVGGMVGNIVGGPVGYPVVGSKEDHIKMLSTYCVFTYKCNISNVSTSSYNNDLRYGFCACLHDEGDSMLWCNE